MDDTIHIEGLDELFADLGARTANIAYVALSLQVNRTRDEQLARVEFNKDELGAYLTEHPYSEPTAVELVAAAKAWAQANVVANVRTQRSVNFRLKFWSNKGAQCIKSGTLRAINTGLDEDAIEVPELPTLASPQAINALGQGRVIEGFTTLQGTMQAGFMGLLSAGQQMWGSGARSMEREAERTRQTHEAEIVRYEGQITRAYQRVKELEGQLQELTGQLLNVRIDLAENAMERGSVQHRSAIQQELGKQFISEVGGIGRTILVAKYGIDPEALELVQILASDPKLGPLLRNPKLRVILSDAETRSELAQLLTMLIEQRPEAAASNSPPPTEERQAA